MNMPINPVAAGTTANPMAAGANPAAASPLGGFEALLAALFPGGEGQAPSPLAKPGQAADGEADGADDDTPAGVDATAQTLLAAFMTTAPVPPAASTPAQGEAEPASAGAAVPAPQTLSTPILPAPTGAATSDPAQADPAQPASAGFAEALAAGTAAADTTAKTPGPEAAATAAPTAADEPPPQDLLASRAPQSRPTAEAAPNPTSPLAPVSPQAQQVAAASNVPAGKPAAEPTEDPDASPQTQTGEGGVKTEAAAGMKAAAGDTPAVQAPGLRKPERADAPAQPPAQQADVAPQPTHAPASAETAPAASTAPAHASSHAAGVRGSPETVATLAAEILKKLDARTTRFQMELNPAGLGKVDVRLEIGAHGRLTAAMAFENPQSAQDLKNRSGELARALEQAGFDVSDGLSFDVADNSGGSKQNNGAQDETRDAPWRGRAFLSALETAGAADVAPPAAMYLARTRAAGVDIKI